MSSGDTACRPARAEVGALTLLCGLAGLVLEYGRRKVAHVVARQWTSRIRRNPATVTRALRSAKRVLIVCHGNIIRSPFAAHLVAQAAGDTQIAVVSGGLHAVPGRPPHPTAASVAKRRGIDLARHVAAPIGPGEVASADVIFVMDIPQLVEMWRRFPEAHPKTFLLASLAPGLPLEVRDPVEGDEPLFETCFDHVAGAVAPLVHGLLDRAQGPVRPGSLS